MNELRAPKQPFFMPDFENSAEIQDIMDRSVHALQARSTLGLSPKAITGAYADWFTNLMNSPGKQYQLVEKALSKAMRLANFTGNHLLHGADCEACIEPLPIDKRFKGDAWKAWPFNVMSQAFLLNQQWWHNATTDVRGVTKQHENVVEFVTRQMLDIFSPSNFLMTNPELLQQTLQEGGQNLVRGARNMLEDWERTSQGKPAAGTEQFKVGQDIAITPGKVVYRNHLIELIQYAPTTENVQPEPILIVPAWIMKYYILDLSPDNSLVRYLTQQGFTVFMVSWRNPDKDDRDYGMDDYRELGIMQALDAVCSITGQQKVHGVGYCLGGTLLSIAASSMARDGDTRFQTLSFFAAQTDFTEAGELMLFINESQVTFLEDMMWEQGFLDTKQMAGAFQILRSNDLIWSRMVHDYLMGKRSRMNDLMAWNADATRMPYRMHSEYLRQLFLNNDLAEGRFKVNGKAISVEDIDAPIFAVGTEWDHVAPWHSVYKFRLLTDTELTFLLTNGGHNAGIVSEPGHPRRHYRMETMTRTKHYEEADTWAEAQTVHEGSWWPEFASWLKARSGEPVAPPAMGAPKLGFEPICDAPGTYVMQK
jgi:polyhydroxyalkanoate synthase